MFKKFLAVCVIALVAFVVIGIGAMVNLGLDEDFFDGEGFLGGVLESVFGNTPPPRTNVLVLGTDHGHRGAIGRADMIMLITICDAGQIDMVSIPRDTRVTMPQYRLDTLRAAGRNTAASSGIMRINEITHHAGPHYGPRFLTAQVADMLDIQIDYYIHVDLAGFRSIVDRIGGIYFDVPIRMYYRDPYQDLVINLQPGPQLLDGNAAEGLVRFRSGHADGDLGRMRTQQDFMSAALGQILSRDNIMANPMAYISTFINYVDTDFGLMDAPPFAGLLGQIDTANITAHTLAAAPTRIDGRFFYILEEDAARLLMDEILTSNSISEENPS